MIGARILIVEDDASIRELLENLLTEAGYEIKTVQNGTRAIEAAEAAVFNLYMIDLRMPGMDGIETFRNIRKINSEALCIILSGYGTIELSVKAMKAGVFDFITKPFQSNEVLTRVKNALEHDQLKSENRLLQKTVQRKFQFDNMVACSSAMQQVNELVEQVSDTDSTILIEGESGTGKEVIAKTIHYNSPRKNKPMIPVNCGAIPETLLESELFGHEKGAFTGATSSRIGRFELAHGSTLFLDEISEMPVPLQVKLLRVLQEREFERVGGNKSIQVDVRIVAATNQNLEQAVAEKRFRKDLFYRLNVIPIHVPPLRERKEDIPPLINHFIQKFNRKRHRKNQDFSPEVVNALIHYPWPGNVRELENLVERLMTLVREDIIGLKDLPAKYSQSDKKDPLFLLESPFEFPDLGIDFSKCVARFEDHLLEQALLKANGIKSRAAQLLHLNRTTLVEKMKKRVSSAN